MNDLEGLSLREQLEKLLRLMAMGRIDAAIKLAEVLAEALQSAPQPVEAKKKAK